LGRTTSRARDFGVCRAEFDPQADASRRGGGEQSMLNGLSGSGWASLLDHDSGCCSTLHRRTPHRWVRPGVNEVRWLAPLRPGDDLSLDVDVVEGAGVAQPSRDRHSHVQEYARNAAPGVVGEMESPSS